MNKTAGSTAIQAGIGKGFLAGIFRGKSFIHCMIELLKNCRDWGATNIYIITKPDRSSIKIVDNGEGMGARNRDAFFSINMTTTSSAGQAGKFGTGTKQMLFSHTHSVQIRTAPLEEPDWVYEFSFTAAEYEALVLKRGTLSVTRLPKDKKTWLYEFKTGTEIVYTLASPDRRGILRGDSLASELAARLPRKFMTHDIVQVDGKSLPQKAIVGQAYLSVRQDRQLGGTVGFEIYQPEKRRPEEDLRLTAVEIGEVPIHNLVKALGDLGVEIPVVLLLPEVCGTISVPFLRDHANEDRQTLSSTIADDPRTKRFVALLNEVAPDVERHLKLSTKVNSGDNSIGLIRDMAERFTNHYGDGKAPAPPVGPSEPQDIVDDGSDTQNGGEDVQLRLRTSAEFEVGETIEIRAILADSLEGMSLKDVRWHTGRALANNLKLTATGITLTAREVGNGMVTAEIVGTPHSGYTHYRVVPQRRFRITIPAATVRPDSELVLMTINHDKLRGELRWMLTGAGRITPEGKRATYTATRIGTATVTAYDSKDASIRATCEITVVGKPQDLICIRGRWFAYEVINAPGVGPANSAARPINMVPGATLHRLMINQGADSFKAAEAAGKLSSFLEWVMAMEFAHFERFKLGEMDLMSLDPRDMPRVEEEVRNLGFEIIAEMMRATK